MFIHRDKDYIGVSSHREAHQQIQTPGEFFRGRDKERLWDYHPSIYWGSDNFQPGGQSLELYPCLQCEQFNLKKNQISAIVYPSVGIQHPAKEGRGWEDSLWRSRPRHRFYSSPRFQMEPKTGKRSMVILTIVQKEKTTVEFNLQLGKYNWNLRNWDVVDASCQWEFCGILKFTAETSRFP